MRRPATLFSTCFIFGVAIYAIFGGPASFLAGFLGSLAVGITVLFVSAQAASAARTSHAIFKKQALDEAVVALAKSIVSGEHHG